MKSLIFVFLIFFLGSLFLPLTSLAGKYFANGHELTYEGFVPCGKCLKISPPVIANEMDAKYCQATENRPTTEKYFPCQLCHFFVMIDGILDFILTVLLPPVATIVFVIGGLMLLFAGGNFQLLERAKGILIAGVIGVVIILTSFLIVNAIFSAIGVTEISIGLNPANWFEIKCPIKL